ncbi:hypothetical protein M3J09_007456 [Ascochyta lentis]
MIRCRHLPRLFQAQRTTTCSDMESDTAWARPAHESQLESILFYMHETRQAEE